MAENCFRNVAAIVIIFLKNATTHLKFTDTVNHGSKFLIIHKNKCFHAFKFQRAIVSNKIIALQVCQGPGCALQFNINKSIQVSVTFHP